MKREDDGDTTFNRGTGLLVIEVRHSNPNGDPMLRVNRVRWTVTATG